MPAEPPKFSAEIEAKLKMFPMVKQKNLRIKLARYESGQASQWEERQLKEDGIIDAGKESAEQRIDVCDSQEALAARMARHYQNEDGSSQLNFVITKKVISDWCKLKRLDPGQHPPPGTMPGVGKRYSFSAWTGWFDKYLLDKKKLVPDPAGLPAEIDDEDLTAMEQREKRDAIKHRRWERDVERGEYIHRSIALATGIAAVKRLHLMVKQEDERGHTKLRREKLLELGVSAEVVEQFAIWDKEQMRQATDRREMEMETVGLEIPEQTN